MRERSVLCYCPGGTTTAHETVTHQNIARVIARLLERPLWLGSSATHGPNDPMPYYVPAETLDRPTARLLGIHAEADVFGGVVPEPFVASKVITHPLLAPDATAPLGWSHAMGAQVAPVVLPGYTAFTVHDARLAGRKLLADGPVRLKDPGRKGGLGQTVVTESRALDAWLDACADTVTEFGVVLECDLSAVETCSVGQIMLDGTRLSYVGTQRLTSDNAGQLVYGGSVLEVVRGDFDALLCLPLTSAVRHALDQAVVYHRAAMACYAGLIVSRCNYDVIQGRDAGGQWRSGVLEQSWRAGGATGAELAAYAALRDAPDVLSVRAETVERYGGAVRPPPDAEVYFDGDDGRVGPLLKYARVESDART